METLTITQEMLKSAVFAEGTILKIKAQTRESKKVKVRLDSYPKNVQAEIKKTREGDILDNPDGSPNQLVWKYPQIEQVFEFDMSGETLKRFVETFALAEMRIKAQAVVRAKQGATKWMSENPTAKFKSVELGTGRSFGPKKSGEDHFAEMAVKILEIAQGEDRATRFQEFLAPLQPNTRTMATMMFQGACREVDEAGADSAPPAAK